MRHFALIVAITLVAPSALAAEEAAAPKKTAQAPAGKKTKKKKPAAAAPAAEPAPAAAPPPPPPPPPPAPVEQVSATKEKDTVRSSDEKPTDEEKRPISIAPMLGYGTSSLNLGIGVRGGYTINERIYVGAGLVYHFGSSTDMPDFGGSGGAVKSSVSVLIPAVEAGYDIPVGPVILRPYGGLGAAVVLSSITSSSKDVSQSDTKVSAAIYPGFQATYEIPKSRFFVGADTRVVILTSGGDPSFGMFATGGARF